MQTAIESPKKEAMGQEQQEQDKITTPETAYADEDTGDAPQCLKHDVITKIKLRTEYVVGCVNANSRTKYMRRLN